ncbi:MAG: 2-oxoglutarate dehydrogenase complex dihydrolipoyllysine-residue succinyltransferase [Alphaproteobacteria bacterium]|nr:MAG: 2-oxoglutarate dehydrogenase complex dihydrolipoyllysine-residue succinyltransferase [Alphaproteobacteria bacterium]
MSTEIKVPSLGESVSEATIAKWLKNPGDAVKADEPVAELETDKVTVEVPAPTAGVLSEIRVQAGQNVKVGAVIATIGAGTGKVFAAPAAAPVAPKPSSAKASEGGSEIKISSDKSGMSAEALAKAGPAARKAMAETGNTPQTGSGKDGRVTRADVFNAPVPVAQATSTRVGVAAGASGAREERVKMSRLRQKIAERLKQAQNTAAMLTTFNEIDMTAVMNLREQYKESFEKMHGVKLGFMSLFVKAAIQGLKELPAVNAEIAGDEIIYKNYYDIGVAVGTEQGLVVPVVRDADALSFAEIEKKIGELGRKAKDGKLGIDELTGGTFTITNGGIYGSLMSTPILNPPQSGILGMHKIQKRPIAVGDKLEIRPMMYVALSYDHRIIDGREAVTFLVRVKECIEDPQRLLLAM